MGSAAVSTSAQAAGLGSTFLVLAPQGTSTAGAVDRVTAAGGTVVADYRQIGVLVARSTNPAFDSAVAGSGVESVASTTGLGTALEDDATIETVTSVTQKATGDPTGEPLFGLQWDMTQIGIPEAHAGTTGSPNVVVGVLAGTFSLVIGAAFLLGVEDLLPNLQHVFG